MFWLFRRKKVGDKKTITPCVYDSGGEPEDAFTLHEFSSSLDTCENSHQSTSNSGFSRLSSFGDSRGTKKGYQRLQGESSKLKNEDQGKAQTFDITAKPSTSAASSHTVWPQQITAENQYTNNQSRIPSFHCEYEISSSDCSDCDNDLSGFNSDSYDDEDLTCTVCDRSFYTIRQLHQHQQKKRHYGCSICDSIFPNLMALELHKETLDHWSEDELRFRDTDSEADMEDYYDGIYDSIPGGQELERLL